MLESLFNKVKLQAFRSSEHLFLKTSAKNGCLVRNMSLKTQKLDQGATEMFISEFEKEKSLWMYCPQCTKTAMPKKQVSKDCLNYLRDSISLILKDNNSISVF